MIETIVVVAMIAFNVGLFNLLNNVEKRNIARAMS